MPKNAKKSAKTLLLTGVFWRILVIEIILLIWSLFYRAIFEGGQFEDLLFYTLRIVVLIGIIILFMMITLGTFLRKKIIYPLEAITEANRFLEKNDPKGTEIPLSGDEPKEIEDIVASRSKMLDNLMEVSRERLNLVEFIRDTFGRYLSKEVVQQILESPEGRKIGGKREVLTILLSDLRGFTTLSETRPPEETVLQLNRYFGRMSEIILDYGGIIDEFIGDGILAAFGIPRKHKEDEARAAACALAMQNALLDLNMEFTTQGYPTLEMGIAVNTGTVVVGNIGSEIRQKFGLVGAAVNVTSRMESMSVGGQVLLGESTYQTLKDRVTASAPITAMMKGLTKPLVCYPISAIGPPYDLRLEFQDKKDEGVVIQLPFHCWSLEEKQITGRQREGETLRINENIFLAEIDPPYKPLTDIKLQFQFCTDAHCFNEIYTKVISVEVKNGRLVHTLRITSISREDRDILAQWISQIS